MEDQQNQQPPLYGNNSNQQNYSSQQIPLPNASTVLALGIISIVGCCCSYGIIGLICSIIALVMAKSANTTYLANPSAYTEGSYNNMKSGKTCALIALILSILTIIMMIIFSIIYGMAMLSDPQSIMNMYNH